MTNDRNKTQSVMTGEANAGPLHTEETRYRSFIEQLPDLVWQKDRDGVYLSCNRRYADALGVQPEEVTGKRDEDFYPAPVAAKFREDDAWVLCGTPLEIEEEVQHRNGTRWFSTRKFPLLDPAGAVIGTAGIARDITQQRSMEQDLRDRETRFRALVENIPQRVFLKDAESRFLGVNAHFARELGVPPEEAIGKTDFDFFPRDLAEKYREDDRRVIASGQMEELEETHVENGETQYVHTIKVPVSGSDGQALGVFGIFWDVTAQRRAEQALRLSEERLQLAMTVANDGMWDYNLVTKEDYLDARFYTMAGYEPDEFPAAFSEVQRRIHPSDLPAIVDAAEKHIQGESEHFRAEYRFRRKDGSWMWILGRGKIVAQDAEGQPARFVGTHTDITARKQTEEALRNNEAIFRSFCSNIPGIAFLLDAEGVFRMSEGRGLAALGLSPGEVVGRSVFDVYQAVPQVCEEMRRVLAGEEFASSVRLGSLLFETYYAPLTSPAGEPAGMLGLAQDITERKRLEEERLMLERQVLHAQKLESLGVLAGGIAHDFNNLLMSILGNADLALHQLSPMSPARENLAEIEKASRRAAELAKQMLAYSGRGRFVIESIAVNGLVEEMAHLLEVTISKKAVLKLSMGRNLPSFEGDATQVRQVIMNLITNASEAVGERSGFIALTTGVMDCDRRYLASVNDMAQVGLDEPLPEGAYVFIEVADNGCGMDPATLSKIFDPFFTTKFTGRGLGMSAVLGIVRGHKGAIKVYSEPGRGSTFKVLFPEKVAAGHTVETPHDKKDPEKQWRGTGTILLADDEEAVCSVGRQMLERMGFAVLTAPHGRAAVDIFRERKHDIDCVLLDLTMPHLDGEQAFREIRVIRPEAAVILCSGYNEQEATHRFCGKGLAGFLQKPYNMAALREKLREVLTQ